MLSVIIVSYLNLEVLIETIESVKKHNDIGNKLELIVVDNSPTDLNFNYLRVNYPEIKVVKNENRGFGDGNNVGVLHATNEYLLFLNPDIIITTGIFKKVISVFESNKDISSFGVQIRKTNLKKDKSFYYIQSTSLLHTIDIKLRNKLGFFKDKNMFISGANIFIKKSVFLDVGGFDSNIFLYNEESDLYIRMREKGYRTSFVKSISIVHIGGQTTPDNLTSFEERLKSKLYLANKHDLEFDKMLALEIRILRIKKILRFYSKNRKKITNKKIEILKKYKKKYIKY